MTENTICGCSQCHNAKSPGIINTVGYAHKIFAQESVLSDEIKLVMIRALVNSNKLQETKDLMTAIRYLVDKQ